MDDLKRGIRTPSFLGAGYATFIPPEPEHCDVEGAFSCCGRKIFFVARAAPLLERGMTGLYRRCTRTCKSLYVLKMGHFREWSKP